MKNILPAAITIILMILGFIAFKITAYVFMYVGCDPILDIKQFVKDEYEHVRELGVHFLTIVLTVFGGSLAFSEKIVSSHVKSKWAVGHLIVAWSLLVASIGFLGCGLTFFSGLLHQGLHTDPQKCTQYSKIFNYGVLCYVIGGISFGCSLISLLCAGIISMFHTSKAYS